MLRSNHIAAPTARLFWGVLPLPSFVLMGELLKVFGGVAGQLTPNFIQEASFSFIKKLIWMRSKISWINGLPAIPPEAFVKIWYNRAMRPSLNFVIKK